MRRKVLGYRTRLTGLRSAAPVFIRDIAEIPKLYDEFWAGGNLDPKVENLQPNPTFLLSHDRILTLHYGTDPLLGFHLATAFTPLKSASPLRTSSHAPSHLSQLVRAALTELFARLDTFAAYQRQKLRIRFAGDVLAFGHTLQQETGGHRQWRSKAFATMRCMSECELLLTEI